MKHGGDLLTYANEYHGELVDFSSNINPLGIPEGLTEVLINSFKDMESYPDIKYRKLKKSIAKYLKCDSNNILVGNGAVEIINNFIIPSKRVITMAPAFSEYEERAIAHGKKVKRIKYHEDFSIDIEAIDKVLEENDLLILGNPNNPTGVRVPQKDLIKIYELIISKNAFLLLDEAFYEFCPEDYDSIKIFKEFDYKNIGIIRAATKFFALPGIRLGYGCTSTEKIEEIEAIQLPWSVNSLADTAGQFIFEQEDYIKKSKEYMETEREFMLEELSELKGMAVYNTYTNYILIKLLNWSEEFVFKHFLKYGIVIRKCSSFKELQGDFIRVAIKDRDNNKRLIEAFRILVEMEEEQ